MAALPAPYYRGKTCSRTPSVLEVAGGVGGAVTPGPEGPRLVAGIILLVLGHKECIQPLRGFGVGLVVGAAFDYLKAPAK